VQYTLSQQIDRVVFRILRTVPFTRNTLIRVRGGPLQGAKMMVSVGNPYLFGYYEEDATQRICGLIRPGDVVYDLGANAGYYAMVFAKYTRGRIHAFEPMPDQQQIFRYHLATNHVENVVLHPFAVSDVSGTRQFSNVAAMPVNTYVSTSSSFDISNSTISVETVSIDDFVYVRGFEPPQVMKIDVEGAELDVLMGARRVLTEVKPFLLLGTHDVHYPDVREKCCQFLRDLGYTVEPTDEDKSSMGLDDFICLPPPK